MMSDRARRSSGFALIITLSLLALLVLTVLALSALTKVNSQIASSSLQQVQARQNALLGIDSGLSALQRYAGDDTSVTGMAGITGIAANAANNTRHWCGVWRQNGAFVVWLASGAQTGAAALQGGVAAVELIGANTVGAAAANSEHGIAGKLPIVLTDTAGAPGIATTVGHYAYLVTDEGVKISAYAPVNQLALAGVRPLITSTAATSAAGKLAAAIDGYAGRLPAVLTYEQLSLLPTPAAALTPSVLQDNFNHITLTARTVSGAQYLAGTINLNTTSALVWRSVLETYNATPGAVVITPANLTTKGNALANGFAASTLGKPANAPFPTVASFGTYLATIFPVTGTPTGAQIMATMGGMFSVRSDTFRIRGYGEVLNPVDSARIEATAYGEVIVQRTPALAPNGQGRRFVVISFRWLGPNDI
jgi:Tfp pilus assembly protein PilV